MKLQYKAWLLTGVVTALIAGLSVIFYSQLQDLRKSYDRHYLSVQVLLETQQALQDLPLSSSDPSYLESSLRTLYPFSLDARIAKSIRDDLKELKYMGNEITSLLHNNTHADNHNLIYTNLPLLKSKVRSLISHVKEVIALEKQNFSEKVSQTALIILVGTLFCALVCVGTAIYVGCRLIHPISLFTRFCHRVAKGDFRLRLKSHHNNEIGTLAQALNSMTCNLKKAELQHKDSHLELANQSRLLEKQRKELELKNQEIVVAKRAIEQKAKELEKSGKYKSEFLNKLSHELRTPLNSIILLSEMLFKNSKKNLSDKEIKFASTIHSSGNELLSLINDLLDLGKIEAGKFEVHESDIEVSTIADYLESHFTFQAKHCGLNFIIDISPDLPSAIQSDWPKIQQVLKNLLSNAFKFTEEGSVYCYIGPSENDSKQLVFQVKDSGIGIPKDQLQSIFDAFTQAEKSTYQRFGGTGLGLSICKEIAGMLGGSMHVSSEEGVGSCFTFTIPLKTGKPGSNFLDYALKPSQKRKEERTLQSLTILLVEDNMRNILTTTEILERQGHQVIPAYNGKTALDILDHLKTIDLVLMDTIMPKMDGHEAIQHIRQHPMYHEVPIIALTASVQEEDLQHCLDSGANMTCTKPLNPSELFPKISQLTGHHNEVEL